MLRCPALEAVVVTCVLLLSAASRGQTGESRSPARTDPSWRADRYRVAHEALFPGRAKEVVQKKRDLEKQLSSLRPDAPLRPLLEGDLVASTTHAKHLSLALKSLRKGSTIGEHLRTLYGEIKTREKQIKALKPRVDALTRLRRWSTGEGAPPESAAIRAEKQRLRSEIAGLEQTVWDLRDNAHGWQGLQIVPEAGAMLLLPFVGTAGVRVGVQLNGPDTGLFPVRPYVRGQISGTLGVASVRGTGVAGAVNGAYSSVGLQNFAGVEYSMRDPVAQSDKLSLRVLGAQASLTRGGVELGLGAPIQLIPGLHTVPAPIIVNASVLVQGPKAKKVSKKLRESNWVMRRRQKSRTVDRALSDNPPPPTELYRMFQAERAERKAKKAAQGPRLNEIWFR